MFPTRLSRKHSFALLSLLLSLLLSACGLGESGDTRTTDDNNADPTLTDTELSSLGKSATVQIKASGKSLDPDGTELESWWGSGFFIRDTGYIVTNNHVVTGSGELKVRVDGTSSDYSASVVGVDECADLAVIKLTSGSGFPALSWYDRTLNTGIEVAAFGFPSDVTDNAGTPQFTQTNGIINTEPRKQSTYWASVEAVNHSALIHGGNSGGPLLIKSSGKVAGVNFAGTNSRYLAIDNLTAKTLTDRLISGENINSIGASLELYSAAGEPLGIFVNAVQAGGKASEIGIKPGDIITELASVPLYSSSVPPEADRTTLEKYCSILQTNNPNNPADPNDKGKTIAITIARNGQTCEGEINGKALTCDTGGITQPVQDEFNVYQSTLDSSDTVLDDGTYYETWTITANSSGTARIFMYSTQLDSFIFVQDVNGNDIAFDDDSAGGLDAYVEFDIVAGETYNLYTNEFEPTIGDYELWISTNLDVQ